MIGKNTPFVVKFQGYGLKTSRAGVFFVNEYPHIAKCSTAPPVFGVLFFERKDAKSPSRNVLFLFAPLRLSVFAFKKYRRLSKENDG